MSDPGALSLSGDELAERLYREAIKRFARTVSARSWRAPSALIMPGVTVGDGAIVAAGAVVASDVPPYGTVAGNPARLIRRRYSDQDIDRLLRIAWWDWPIETITEHVRTIWAGTPAELDEVAARAGLLR